MTDKELESVFVYLPIGKLEPNEGQLEGLPANPRKITPEKLEQLKMDIQEYPEMLEMTGVLVYPLDNGNYIIICHNQSYRAVKELGWKKVPCAILPKDTSMDRLKAYAVIDNNSFGKWDWDMLANEWDALQLSAWGVALFISEEEIKADDFCSDGDESKTKNNGGKINVLIPEKLAEKRAEICRILDEGLKAYEGVIVK